MAIDKIFDGAVDGIADNLFNSVSNSVSEIKAMQQRKAAENVQLVVQALKKIDADIREKYDGVTETIEKRVANIKDGRDGIDGKNGLDGVNGKDGRDGKDGRNGRDGLTGPRGFDGPKGADGKDGQNGEDGVSITDAHIDFDGSLIISLSSGRVINVGEVVAADIAEKIKVITNGGGTSQPVLDQLASLQAQIDLISSALVYKGTWNASTNTPTLTSSAGTANTFYIVSVAGTTTLNGTSNWGVGDWAVYNGSVWQRIEGGAVGNFTDLSVSGTTTLSGLTASTALALNASKQVVSVTNTGSGSNVLATSPTLVTPALGTPSSATLTNATGLPLSTGVTGTLPIANGGTGQTSATNAFTALAPSQSGNSGKYLTTNGTSASWATVTSGDVTGPSSATANGIVLFNSTTGKIIKDSASTDGLIYGLTVGRGAGSISSNTAFGATALNGNTTGYNNTGIGKGALNNNLGAYNNTAVGFQSGFYHSSGNNNTSVGSQALFANQTGSENVALGVGALYTNDSGQNNIAIGYEALKQSTLAGNNTSVGHQSLYSSGQTIAAGSFVVGTSYKILVVGTTSWTSIGAASNTVGIVFTATGVGSGSGSAVVNGGANNTALGYLSGYSVTGGSGNTFIGYSAGLSITSGSTNTTLGFDSGKGITTGSKNVIIGSYAGIVAPISMTGSNFIVLSDGDANVRGVFDSSGNFGVGTTSPGSRLDVKGTLRLSGSTSGYVGLAPAAAAGSTTYILPSADGTSGQSLVTNGSGTLSWASGTGGTVTSVAASVPTFLSISGSPITSSGTLAITLSGTALPTTSGGTGLTSFTSGGVVYASSTSALTTGSALQFDGTNLLVGTATALASATGRGNITINGSTDALLAFGNDAALAGYILRNTSGITYFSDGDTFQRFFINSSEQMRLTSTGLGIGTSSPSTKLSVSRGGSAGLVSNFTDGLAQGLALTTGTGYFGFYNPNYGAITFRDGGNAIENMRLTDSGNLGLGVTPSAWNSDYKALNYGSAGLLYGRVGSQEVAIGTNWYRSSAGSFLYSTTGFASYQAQVDGVHYWFTAPSGTAGNAITFTQAMTLNASGNLGIGTSSPYLGLSVYKQSDITFTNLPANLVLHDSTAMAAGVGGGVWFGGRYLTGSADATTFAGISGIKENGTTTDVAGTLVFGVRDSSGGTTIERMRLNSSGNLGIGTSSPTQKLEASYNDTSVNRQNPVNVAAITATSSNNGGAPFTGFGPALVFRSQSYNGTVYNGPRVRMVIGDDSVSTTVGSSLAFDITATKGASPTQAAIIDPSGNLGLGVTPSAWNSSFKVMQMGGTASIYGRDSTGYDQAGLYSNARFASGTNDWRYLVTTTGASGYLQSAGAHNWFTAPSGTAGNAITFTQAMTLDASGNLLVGKTSGYRSGKLVVSTTNVSQTSTLANVHITTTDTQAIDVGGSLGLGGQVGADETAFGYISGRKENGTSGNYAGYLAFATQNSSAGVSEAARITSGGNLLVGTTTAQTGVVGDAVGITLYGSSANGVGVFVRNSSLPVLYINNKTSGGALIQFYNGGNTVGDITSNGTTTSYNTSSDYRLKNTIAPMTGALAKLALLKPCTYKWNADGSDGEGFIAHELAKVVPQCVTGEKDAVDENGNPKYQGIDTSFLVATLTAALQEAVAEINSLKARLDAANL